MSPSHQSALCGISSVSELGEWSPANDRSRYSVMERAMLQTPRSVSLTALSEIQP